MSRSLRAAEAAGGDAVAYYRTAYSSYITGDDSAVLGDSEMRP